MAALTKTFYMAVWNAGTCLSDKDAARRYASFSVERTVSRFDEGVYQFYSALTRYYPDTDMLSEEELDSSPWACAMEAAGDHIVIGVMPDWCAKVFPLILELANTHGLVCFDPQNVKVYPPERLTSCVVDAAQVSKVDEWAHSLRAADQLIVKVAPRRTQGRLRAAIHGLLQLIL